MDQDFILDSLKTSFRNSPYYPIFVDRLKLYASQHLDPDINATTLQTKVIFDIRLYLLRRGQENMDTMQKDDFAVLTDAKSGLKYVQKVMNKK